MHVDDASRWDNQCNRLVHGRNPKTDVSRAFQGRGKT